MHVEVAIYSLEGGIWLEPNQLFALVPARLTHRQSGLQQVVGKNPITDVGRITMKTDPSGVIFGARASIHWTVKSG